MPHVQFAVDASLFAAGGDSVPTCIDGVVLCFSLLTSGLLVEVALLVTSDTHKVDSQMLKAILATWCCARFDMTGSPDW